MMKEKNTPKFPQHTQRIQRLLCKNNCNHDQPDEPTSEVLLCNWCSTFRIQASFLPPSNKEGPLSGQNLTLLQTTETSRFTMSSQKYTYYFVIHM